MIMLFSLFFVSASFAEDRIQIGIDEKLGSYLPLSSQFNDENGNPVNLKDLITGPTVISLVYYQCPGICNPLLFALSDVVNKSDLEPGYDYNIVSISFDEFETPEIASKKKSEYFSGLDKDITPESWRFLTGNIENIKKVTGVAGFYFKREGNELRHAGALIFVDKNGKICRYLFPGYTDSRGYGILPLDFKMAVLETSEGKESPTIARMLRFCFSYDTEGQKYVLNFTRIFGAVILIFAVGFVLVIKFKPKKESIKKR
jgi:protein SCO1/2